MSQNELVLKHLQRYGSITPLQAFDLYGIMRLGARIYDLKRQGENIRVHMEQRENRFGDTVRYARYFISENT